MAQPERDRCPKCGMRLPVCVPDGSYADVWCRSVMCHGQWWIVDKRRLSERELQKIYQVG